MTDDDSISINEMGLRRAHDAVAKGIDYAITTLRGSVEFRNAVEQLLVGTPNEKPPDERYDFEGLYGRLRNQLEQTKHS